MNPFRDAIVANPWNETRADVTSIHGDVFDACVYGIETVRKQHRSAAILIHGEAGSGKTHLLSRLRSHLAPRMATATDRAEYLYVWVRLQTSPRMIWRTLRRTVVDDWFRPVSGHRSQFDRILFHRLAAIRVANGDLEPWYEYMLDEDPDGLRQLIDRIADSLDLDRNTTVAFEHIAFGRHRRDLRAWLAGDSLPEAALAAMNLSTDEGSDEERESQARQVVLMLCRLAGNGLPVVLSFDQVEALQMSPRDLDGPFAFGQMVSTLHDSTSNVLLISCVQSSFFADLQTQQQIRGADYARMTSLGAMSLHSLDKVQAEQLIAARLSSAEATVSADTTLNGAASAPRLYRPSADAASPVNSANGAAACWPLDPNVLEALVGKGDLTPRKLLGLCAEVFESKQRNSGNKSDARRADAVESDKSTIPIPDAESKSTDAKFAKLLDDIWKSTYDRKLTANTPDQTEEIIRHGLPLLVRLICPQYQLVRDELLREVPLLFEGPEGRTGISLRIEASMASLQAKFGHLAQDLASGRVQRLIVLRDSRRPLTKTAKVAQKKLDDLQQSGAIVVFPSIEVLAALDSVRSLLSDAKSGDLDLDGTTIDTGTLEDWLVANLDPRLRPFVTEVFGCSSENKHPPHREMV